MTKCNVTNYNFQPVKGRRIEASFNGGDVSSDGGSLLLREADRSLDLTKRIADILQEDRQKAKIQHSNRQMQIVRQLCRPYQLFGMMGKSVSTFTQFFCLCSFRYSAENRACGNKTGKSHLRNNPAQAVKNRSCGNQDHPYCPGNAELFIPFPESVSSGRTSACFRIERKSAAPARR